MKMTKTSKLNYTTPTYDALVTLTRSLRPSWDEPGIRAAIRNAINRQPMPTLADLAYALVRIAIDPTVTNPGVLAMTGPHWGQTTAHFAELQPPRRCERCHEFHGLEAPCPQRHDTDYAAIGADGMASVRAAYTQATADLCPHGVGWRDCHQHNGHVIAGQVTHSEETE
jgi:hypothetical protein